MELTATTHDAGVSLVRLDGRMDPHATQQVKARLREETVGRDRPAVVDMSGVGFITSIGVGVIVDVAVSVKKAGHAFALVVPAGLVRTVLDKTGVSSIIAVADSVEEALRLVNGSAP
jgi:anti-sigma B factor antagonist